MVRCEVCGKEVLSGWICGVVPAPDNDKLGLCPEHDSPQKRQEVQQKWEALLRDKLERTLASEHRQAEAKAVQLEVTIHYLGGGVHVQRCRAYDVNQEGDLLILKEDGNLEFYPLQHIRRFVVADVSASGQPVRQGGDTATDEAAS